MVRADDLDLARAAFARKEHDQADRDLRTVIEEAKASRERAGARSQALGNRA
jgi:hypothetical protein